MGIFLENISILQIFRLSEMLLVSLKIVFTYLKCNVEFLLDHNNRENRLVNQKELKQASTN